MACAHTNVNTQKDTIEQQCSACRLGVIGHRGCACRTETIDRMICVNCGSAVRMCSKNQHRVIVGTICEECLKSADPSDEFRSYQLIGGRWVFVKVLRCRMCGSIDNILQKSELCAVCIRRMRNKCEKHISAVATTESNKDDEKIAFVCACEKTVECDVADLVKINIDSDRRIVIQCHLCPAPADEWLWKREILVTSPSVSMWIRGERKKPCFNCQTLCDEPSVNGVRCCNVCVPSNRQLKFEQRIDCNGNRTWHIVSYLAKISSSHRWVRWRPGVKIDYRCPCTKCSMSV